MYLACVNEGTMKIAIVLNTSWNIYNFRVGLIKRLKKEGFEVIAIAPYDTFSKELQNMGIDYVPLKNLSRKGTNPIRDLLLIVELWDLYRKHQVNFVLQYTIKPVIFGTLAARLAGVKSINTITGLGHAFLSNGLINKLAIRLYRFSFRFSDLVLFHNQDDLQLFVQKGIVANHKAGVIDGSGIDLTHFNSTASLEATMNKEEAISFLFIGRLLKDKGIFEFVYAAEKVLQNYPDTKFQIVGGLDDDNPARITKRELDSLLNKANINYQSNVKDIRPYIQRSDIIVLPSYREGVPRVMLEGMAMGKPLITTDVPGCRETVRDGINGYLVPVKDVNALALAMEKMISIGPKARQQMGIAGVDLAKSRFDAQIIFQSYVNIIERMRVGKLAPSTSLSDRL